VALACHELRGPLTALRLGLEAGGISLARRRALALELGRAAAVLDELSPRWPARPASQPVDVGALLRDSVAAWQPLAAARGVTLALAWRGGEGAVCGQRFRLAQATGNLIANAIEHGGGVVDVRGAADGRHARVEVSDSGPGLPASVAELARRPRAGRGARGRGLAIAGAVAAGHGGRLTAAPSPRGARLVLELPLVADHDV
jgi:signal transduction histidine kinase